MFTGATVHLKKREYPDFTRGLEILQGLSFTGGQMTVGLIPLGTQTHPVVISLVPKHAYHYPEAAAGLNKE